jgi:hypothetical protein
VLRPLRFRDQFVDRLGLKDLPCQRAAPQQNCPGITLGESSRTPDITIQP